MGLKYQFELTSPDWSLSKKTDISMQFRRTEKIIIDSWADRMELKKSNL